MRKSGILLPITSLPSDYGIGCFSKSAYDFVDWLHLAGQSFWQILPLCPTGFGDSPYQSFSTYAGNPYMISLKKLIEEGLLSKEECDNVSFSTDESSIDYKRLYDSRFSLLKKAFERSNFICDEGYFEFAEKNNFWLDDYSVFMALKNKFNHKVWNEWPEDIRLRKPSAIIKIKKELNEEILFQRFIQYKFYSQWESLKRYANEKGISIIGDIPIYVSYDSADVWANPPLFQLDENFSPAFVAGCPPDGFSEKGQKWGNPLYAWKNHQKTNFSWWIERLRYALNLYDTLRIDHFRGFDEYYSVKSESPDATEGEWKKAPGLELFKTAEKELGKKLIIAEDLGFVTDSVKDLLKKCDFPGMKVLQFAFDSRDTGSSNDYLPHNYTEKSVCYTGTHDNQTLFSWLKTISEEEKISVRKYLADCFTPEEKLYKPLIALIMRSTSFLCIVPIQDWLNLSDKARINTPSTLGKNWSWRLTKGQLNKELAEEIYEMTKNYSRL